MMANEIHITVNDGIHLSEIRPGDKAAFVKHLNDEDIYRNTLRIAYPYTDDDAEKFLGIVADATAKHGHPVHFVIRERDDQLIGGCGFDGLSYGHRAEIGDWLAKPYWGRGIMTEVVRSACDFVLTEWRLVRITAHVFDFDEDPVTGSAHCCLAPFWGDRLGRTEMTGFQASSRGGIVRVRVNGNRVILGGQTVTVFKGSLV